VCNQIHINKEDHITNKAIIKWAIIKVVITKEDIIKVDTINIIIKEVTDQINMVNNKMENFNHNNSKVVTINFNKIIKEVSTTINMEETSSITITIITIIIKITKDKVMVLINNFIQVKSIKSNYQENMRSLINFS